MKLCNKLKLLNLAHHNTYGHQTCPVTGDLREAPTLKIILPHVGHVTD